MKMKKALIIVFLVSMLSVILAGCGGTDSNNGAAQNQSEPASTEAAQENTGSKEKFELNLAIWDEKLKDTVNQVIEIYKQDHPEADVQVTVTPVKDYWTKTQSSLVGGDGPDLFMMNGPNFNKFASLGLLSDLQPLIEKDGVDTSVYPQGINELYKLDGHAYGIPFYLGSVGLFYNKELFDQAGVPYPDESWTWDTLKEKAALLTDKAANKYGYIAVNADQIGYYPLIHQAGGSVISADKKTSGLDSEGTIKAIQFMKDLMDQGISPSAQQQLETEALQIFGSGNAAMYPGGSFDAFNLNKLLGDKLGVTVLPSGEQSGFYVHGSSWVINKQSKHQQEAWELLNLLAGKAGQELLGKNAINFPAYTDYVDLWAQSIPSLDMKAFVVSLPDAVAYPVSQNTSEWQKVMAASITEALTGAVPVEEALSKAAQQMNEILSRDK
jgi:multiple sugar transport system substrate-binding protein